MHEKIKIKEEDIPPVCFLDLACISSPSCDVEALISSLLRSVLMPMMMVSDRCQPRAKKSKKMSENGILHTLNVFGWSTSAGCIGGPRTVLPA